MPNALVEKCCTPCRGIPPLTLDVARRYLAQDTPDATREVRQHRCLVAEVSAAAPSTTSCGRGSSAVASQDHCGRP